ncbi:MAG: winged helix-turn-helix transcriptional regulator [Candidatus Thermoplasmatota archaeon]|nr:winged helix-turn-helix transcriptional regulator [Candidatus Thermoplasmatota archaeon]
MTQALVRLAFALMLATLLAAAGTGGAEGSEDLALDPAAVSQGATGLDPVPADLGSELPAAEAAEPTTLDELGALLGAAASAVADAALAAVDAIAAAAGAVGSALLAGLQATWAGILWTGSALWTGITATGRGIAWLGIHAWDGTVWAATGLATGLWGVTKAVGSAIAWTGATLWSGASWLAVSLATGIGVGLKATWNLLVDLGLATANAWPQEPKHQAIVASSAAGAAAAGGAAWYTKAWRYLSAAPFLAPLYARISREDLLDHPMREAIYQAIQEQPGIHVSELGRELDASWGTLLHHVDKLERAQLIVSEEASGKRCFFLPGQVSAEHKEILPALENETARTIATFFGEHPGATQSEACDALGLSAALVSWHIKRLEKAGVLQRTREGRTKRVSLTEIAVPALA